MLILQLLVAASSAASAVGADRKSSDCAEHNMPPLPPGFHIKRIHDFGRNEFIVTFEQPFDNVTGTIFRRRFEIILPSYYSLAGYPLEYVLVDSHGYNTPDFADQKLFSGFYNTIVEANNIAVVTTWGSEDSYTDLAGWNAWGWGESTLPTANGCTDHADATCVVSRKPYDCYASQLLSNGTCEGRVSSTCSTMSAQDDLAYMRTVLTFVKSYWQLTAHTRIILTGQSMGGIISAAATQVLASEGLVDGAVPVSAGAARNSLVDFGPEARVPILHLHGVYDETIPTCIPPDDVRAIGVTTSSGDVAYPVAPTTCDDTRRGRHVCESQDGYLYASLQTTLEAYSAKALPANLRDLKWTTLHNPWFPPPMDERNGTRLRCTSIDAHVTVCLFNGFHCLPYQDADCVYIDDTPGAVCPAGNCTGAMAFAHLLTSWLNVTQAQGASFAA